MGMRYVVIGTGAVGGFYGLKLAAAGQDVHFLMHSDYHRAAAHGLRLDSPAGDFLLERPNVYERAADLPQADVVLAALKTTRNDLLQELLPPTLTDTTQVVMLQNGLCPERDVAGLVPPERIAGGLCFICSNKVGPGHIQHLDYGFLTLGRYSADGRAAGVDEPLRRIGADFAGAGVDTRYAEDLRTARWKKLLWNIPFNGLSVALRTTVDAILGDDDARELARALMEETVAAGRKAGAQIGEADIEHMLELTARMTPYKTSMLLDAEANRPMEVESIFGDPLRSARSSGVVCPRLEMLYQVLAAADRLSRAGSRTP